MCHSKCSVGGMFLIVCMVLVTVDQTYGRILSSPYVVTLFDDLITDPESGIPYTNCGGSESEIQRVTVSPCTIANGDTCEIPRGSNVTFQMQFISEENTKSLKAKIYGVKDFIPIPLPCPQPNACVNSGLTCPINKGSTYNYILSAPILQSYPKVSLKIKGELKDDSGDTFSCVEIKIKLV